MRAKRIIAAFMAALILILALCAPVFSADEPAPMPDTSEVGAVWLYCLDTDSVIAKHNADAKDLISQRIKKFTEIGNKIIFAGDLAVSRIRKGRKDENSRCNEHTVGVDEVVPSFRLPPENIDRQHKKKRNGYKNDPQDGKLVRKIHCKIAPLYIQK